MLELYKPEIKDLWFKQKLLGDEETMSYNRKYGGTIAFPEERWPGWYESWLNGQEDRRFYRYLKESEGGYFVGEAAYHFDEKLNEHLCDIIVMDKYRHKGYGTKGLELLCEAAWKNGLKVLCDNIAIGSPAIGLFIRNGFKEEYRTREYVMLKKTL